MFERLLSKTRVLDKTRAGSEPRVATGAPTKPAIRALEPRFVFDAAAAPAAAQAHGDPAHHDPAHGDQAGGHAEPADARAAAPVGAPLHETATANGRHEIVVIDKGAEDVATLLAGVPSSAEIILIDSTRDGFDQLADALEGRSGIDAIHILSHGSAGDLRLGTGDLTAETIQGRYAADLAVIGKALTATGDLMIYGCDFAAGEAGARAVALLASATGADIAASDDATGATELGGDWTLETHRGPIETGIVVDEAAQADWHHLLATADTGRGALLAVSGRTIYSVDIASGKATELTQAPASVGGIGLSSSLNSLAVDQANGLIYYVDNARPQAADKNALFAYDFRNDRHILIDADLSRHGITIGTQGLGGSGAAFSNGVLYLAVENVTGSTDQIYKLTFTGAGRMVVSGAPFGNQSNHNYDWGDIAIDQAGGQLVSLTRTSYARFNLSDGSEALYDGTVTRTDAQTGVDSGGTIYSLGTTITRIDSSNGAAIGSGQAITTDGSTALGSIIDAASWTPPISTIGGRVFGDANGNGTSDSGEAGLRGVTVQLIDDVNGNGQVDAGERVLATDTSAADGSYRFTGILPGQFVVRVTDTDGRLARAMATTALSGAIADTKVGATLAGPNFGYAPALVLDLDASAPGTGYITRNTQSAAGTAIVDSDVVILDVASTTLTSAKAVITNGSGGDALGIDGTLPAGIGASYDAATYTLTLTGSASLADYQAALQQIRFVSTGSPPATVDRTIAVTVNDGTVDSAVARAIVTLANFPPVNTAPTSQSVAEDTDLVFSAATGNPVRVDDQDGGTLNLTLSAEQGLLSLSHLTGLTFAQGDGANDAVMTCSGSLADINAALDGLRFTPRADYNGPARISLVTQDPVRAADNFVNGSFEAPTIGSTYAIIPESSVPGWKTDATDHEIEIWHTGYNGVPAYDGNQFAEINANQVAALYQTFDARAGSTVSFDFAHRGRAGVDTMQVTVTDLGADGIVGTADDRTLFDKTYSDGNTAWGAYSETIGGATSGNTLRFEFRSISAAGGSPSIGNFIDGIRIQQGFRTESAVDVTVAPVADIVPDMVTTIQNTAITFNAVTGTNGASADTFEDVNRAVSAVSQGGHGSVTFQPDGTLTYTPNATFTGADNFTYTVTAGGTTETTAVTVTVDAAPDLDLDASAPGTGFRTSYGVGGPAIAVVAADVAVTDVDNAQMASARAVIANPQAGDGLTFVGTPPAGIVASYDPATFTLTLIGAASKADYQTALQQIRYASSGSAPSTLERTIAVTVNDGTVDSAIATTTVTVVPANAPPVNTLPAGQTIAEDTGLVFSAGNGNAVTVSDPDAGTGALTTILSVTHGTLSLGSRTGVTVTNDGTAAVTLTGTAAAINAALDGTTYRPNADSNGAETLTIVTSDNGNTGAGGPKSDTDTLAITVTAVNDAPVNGVPGPQVVDEDTGLVFSPGNGNALTIADVDAGSGTVTTLLQVRHGTLTLGGTANVMVTGSGTGSLSLSGTLAAVNAALAGTTYRPDADYAGSDTLTITTNDNGNTGAGGLKSDTNTIGLTVNPVNDPPTSTVPAAVQTANEDTPLIFSASGGNAVSVSDADGGTLTVALSSAQGQLTLSRTTGLTFLQGTGTGDGSMRFSGTVAAINAALEGLCFDPAADRNGPAQISLVTADPAGATATSTIAVTLVPVADIVPDAVATNEDTAITFNAVTGTNGASADTFADTTRAVIAVSQGAHGSVTFQPDGTLTYTPEADFNGTDSFTYTVSAGGTTETATVSVTVRPVNDAPVLALSATPGSATRYTEGGPAVAIVGASLSVTDVDSPSLASATAVITNGQAGDALSIDGALPAGIVTRFDPATFTLTLTGAATPADYQAALSRVRFSSSERDPSTLTRSIDVSVSDGALRSSIATATVAVTAVNDAPVNGLPAAQTTAEDTALVFSAGTGNAVTVSDIDARGGNLTTTLGVAHGTLSLGSRTGVTVTNDGTGAVTLTGTAVAINAALDGTTYRPDANYNGADALTVITSDNGNTGAGGPKSNTDTLAISVTAVNDAPVNGVPVNGVPGPQAVDEDTGLVFSPSNGHALTVSDVDAGSGTVTTLLQVRHGTLTLGGMANVTVTGSGTGSVSLSGTLAAVNAALAGTTYRPDADYAGSDTLTITTNDNGNTGAGGPKSDTDTIDLTVNPVNDPPTSTVPAAVQTANEDTPLIFSASGGNGISVSDADGGTLTVALSSAQGLLTLSRTIGLTFLQGTGTGDGSMRFSGTVAAINAALEGLCFDPAADRNGPAQISLVTADPAGATATSTIAVTLVPVADIVPDAVATNEDTAITFNAVTGTNGASADTFADATRAVTAVSQGAHGSVTFRPDGTLTYTPEADFNGTDSFTYTVSAGGTTETATVTVTVRPINDAPVLALSATPGSATRYTEGGPAVAIVGASLSVTDVDSPSLASATAVITNGQAGDALSIDGALPAGIVTRFDPATFTLTLTGAATPADYQAALSRVRFSSSERDPSTVTRSIDVSVSDGALRSRVATAIVAVTAVNDAPVNGLPAAQTTAEDTALVFSASKGNALTVSDADAGTGALTTTLSVAHGTLSLSSTLGVAVGGDGTGTVTLTGTVAAINAALDGTTYRPNANFNGPDAFTIVTSDNGHTGAGGAKSDIDTLAITVTAVNDAPVNGVPVNGVPGPQAVDEDTGLVFSPGNGNTLTIADVDAASGAVTALLQVRHGTLTLGGMANVTVTGSGTGSVSLSGTLAAVNAALAGTTYRPEADYAGSDTLTITTNDNGNTGAGGPKSDTDAIGLTVNPANDPPTSTVPATVQTANEDTPLIFSASGGNAVSVSDADGGTLTVALSSAQGLLTLSRTIGLTFLQGTGTGDGSMRFSGTVAAINAALEGLCFDPAADRNGPAQISLVTADPAGATATSTIAVTLVPVADIVPDAVATNEDTAITFNAVTGTNGASADTFADATRAVTAVSQGAHGSVTFRPDGTLTYTPEADFNGTDSFTYTVSAGGTTETATVTVTVRPINDAPVLALSATPGSATRYTEGGPAVAIVGASLSVTDVDSPSLASATAVITNGQAGDALSIEGALPAGIVARFDPATFTLTLAGAAMPADYQAALSRVRFSSSERDPSTITRSIDVSVSDGALGSRIATATVAVTAVNDAPVNGLPAAQTTAEDTALVFSAAKGNALTVSDADARDGRVTTTLGVLHGTLSLGATTEVTVRNNGTGTVTLAGTVAAINAALDGTTYRPDADYDGPDALTIVTSDNGHTGAGGPKTDLDALALTVSPVNDAPRAGTLPALSGSDGDHVAGLDLGRHFSDVEGDTLIFAFAGLPPGLMVDSATGIVRGTIDRSASQGGTNGDYAVTVTADDGHGGTTRRSFTWRVVDPAPIARDDGALTDARTPILGSVLADNGNGADGDPDGDPLTVAAVDGSAAGIGQAVTGSGGGRFTVFADGRYRFDPGTDFDALAAGRTGTTRIAYTIGDGDGGTATAFLTVTVTGVAHAPQASDDRATTAEDRPVVIDVLANDRDPDGDALTIVATGEAAPRAGHGRVAIADGKLLYTPDADFHGTDTITYAVTDGNGGTGTASVAVTVTPVNDGPSADPLPDQAGRGGAPVVQDIATHFHDPDADRSTGAVPGEGLRFTATGLPPGLSLDPATGLITGRLPVETAATTDFTVTVTATDAEGASIARSFTWTVTRPVPTAEPDSATTRAGTPVSVAVTANDSDADGSVRLVDAAGATKAVHGTVSVDPATGLLTYGPDDGFSGTDTVVYTIENPHGVRATGLLTVAVTSVNRPPVAPDTLSGLDAADGESLRVPLGHLFVDPEGARLAHAATGLPPGLAIDPATGEISGTLPRDASGPGGRTTYLVTLTATDPEGLSVSRQIAWAITNPAPVAADDAITTAEDRPVDIDVTGNDHDPDGDPLAVVAGSATARHGTVAINRDGSLRYTPDPDFNGTDTIVYTITDGNGGFATAHGTVDVNPVDDVTVVDTASPVVADRSAGDGARISIPAGHAFSDVDGGDVLTFTATGLPPGLAIDPATGEISGMIARDASGPSGRTTYLVTLTATDSSGLSVSRTLAWAITNPAPIAADDTITTAEDRPVDIDVTGNDHDPDGDPLAVVAGSATARHGTVAINRDGSLRYTPDPDFNGTDTIVYTITDGNGGFATAHVTVGVNPVDDAPVVDAASPAVADFSASDGARVSIPAGGAFSDVDEGDVLTFTATGLPPGLALDPATGLISGTVASDASTRMPGGVYAITLTGTDSAGLSATARFTITVANPAPIARDDVATLDEDGALEGHVLDNDADPDGDAIRVDPTPVAGPLHGRLDLRADGGFTYRPEAGFHGEDAFTYAVVDSDGGRSTATVHLTVAFVDTPPTASAAPVTAREDTPADGRIVADGREVGTLAFSVEVPPASGQVTLRPDGSFTYTPAPDFHGDDGFTVRVSDEAGGSTLVTVAATIAAVNDAPDAHADDLAIPPGEVGRGQVVATDRDRDPLDFRLQAGLANGTVALAEDGSYAYTPATGFSGRDSFTVEVGDGSGGVTRVTVAVTVAAKPDLVPPPGAVFPLPGARLLLDDPATWPAPPVETGIVADGFVLQAVAAIDPLGSVGTVILAKGAVVAAVNGVDDLHGTAIDLDRPVVLDLGDRIGRIAWERFERQLDGQGAWFSASPYLGRSLGLALPVDETVAGRSDLMIEAIRRPDTLVINLRNRAPDDAVGHVRLLGPDGAPAPAWIEGDGRGGFWGHPPAGTRLIPLEAEVTLRDGRVVRWPMTVDAETGEIRATSPARPEAGRKPAAAPDLGLRDEAPMFTAQLASLASDGPSDLALIETALARAL